MISRLKDTNIQTLGIIFIGLELGITAIGLTLAHFLLPKSLFLFLRFNSRAWIESLIWSIPPAGLAGLIASNMSAQLNSFKSVLKLFQSGPLKKFATQSNLVTIVIFCFAAGIGEEILFRGVFQVRFGLPIAALLFSVVHAVSLELFTMTFALGLYFGFIFWISGNNLLVPIVAHAACDFVFLLFYRRLERLHLDS